MSLDPRNPKESVIELQILHGLNLIYSRVGFFWKNPTTGYFNVKTKMFSKHSNPYCLNGVPDIVGIIEGRWIGLEVKSKTGVLSLSQKIFHEKARKYKGHVSVVRSLKDAENAVKEVLASIKV